MKKSFGAKTLIFPTPTWVVGVYGPDGRANAMTVAWGGICCSSPPMLAVSLRKATFSYQCILDRKAFTVNVPSEDQAAVADYFGLVSGRSTDKFAATGLTPVRAGTVDAPAIEEFPMVVECRLAHAIELGLHTQFVGEILDVRCEEALLNEAGVPDPARVRPVVYAPEARAYYGLGARLGAAFSMGKALEK